MTSAKAKQSQSGLPMSLPFPQNFRNAIALLQHLCDRPILRLLLKPKKRDAKPEPAL
jgi:hypothetical protein